MSQITTHILDTSIGKPAKGVQIILQKKMSDNSWKELSKGLTNNDGRLPGLLQDSVVLEPGIYQLQFDTESYYQSLKIEGLYPSVSIAFKVKDASHYHIPLLLNPYGFSTYRGS